MSENQCRGETETLRSLELVTYRSTWMIPMFFEVTEAIPRTVGNPIEWSPPRMIGIVPVEAIWATALLI